MASHVVCVWQFEVICTRGPAETLETRGSDAVEEFIVRCQNTETQLIIFAVWLFMVPHLYSGTAVLGEAGTPVRDWGALGLGWWKGPEWIPEDRGEGSLTQLARDCPGMKAKAEGGAIFLLTPSPGHHEKLSSAGSAIPGYVTHLWPQIHLIPFMHFVGSRTFQPLPQEGWKRAVRADHIPSEPERER